VWANQKNGRVYNFIYNQGIVAISGSLEVIEKVGRGEWIRTTDLLVPNLIRGC